MGRTIARDVPPDAVVAIHDAGAVAYFSDRRVYDWVGLATNDRARAYRDGEGSTFEMMERVPKPDRPSYIALYSSWNRIPGLYRNPPLVSLPHPSVGKTDSNPFRLHRIDMGIFERSDRPAASRVPEGWRLAAEVDVADLLSEREAGYGIFDGRGAPKERAGGFRRLDMEDGRAAEGERTISPGWTERFRVRLRPGRPVRVVLRGEAEKAAVLSFQPDGGQTRNLTVTGRKTWTEEAVDLPADRIPPDGLLSMTVRVEKGAYGSAHYWCYQPE